MNTAPRIETEQAEAGHRGDDVRSDCWVRLTRCAADQSQVELTSKVDSLYGESIRTLLGDQLDAMHLDKVRVEMVDCGALPFVLMARVEAAARRLAAAQGAAIPAVLPEWAPNPPVASSRERLRRSRLYLPGNEPRFMLNAGLHHPDAIILDLEDSVAPAKKDEARILVRNALRAVDFGAAERMVRINPGDLGSDDLACVIPHHVHVILIPKVEDPRQVQQVDAQITALQRDHAPHADPVLLMPIIESALGALRAHEIATASPNICALTIGLEDYTADIGAQRTSQGRESFWARAQVINAARAAGVQPIDSVFSDVADMDGLREAALEARALGFDGKGCIHPRQIAVIHQAFAPTPHEVERAEQIVAAFEEAQARGLAAVSLGTRMIDPPVVKRALRIVRQARSHS